MVRTSDRKVFLDAVRSVYGDIPQITRKQVVHLVEKKGVTYPQWLTNNPEYRLGRGIYSLKISTTETNMEENESDVNSDSLVAMAATVHQLNPQRSSFSEFVPERIPGYVPFGHYNDLQELVKSLEFYPVYITGLSGNGKTIMVEEVCAQEKRECIRVNVTIETDEDDLIGGFRLVDGHTVWQDGPVVVAMKRGAVLLLDEVDLGSNKIMCLQPILEGKGIFLKKIQTFVPPVKGFTIIATANTKGKGSEDGRFIGTNVMNEAFLERFSITMEQEYPPKKTELKILKNLLSRGGVENNEFANRLVEWGCIIRKSFEDGAVDEIISTRRLVHIINAFLIWKDEEKAINLCLNRFDLDTKTSFLELYKKLVDDKETDNNPKNQNEPDYTLAKAF